MTSPTTTSTTSATGPHAPAEVTIAVARDAALVRTARLVAASVARRADLSGALIEEVRLGVGEACAVLIGSSDHAGLPEQRAGRTADPADMVEVSLRIGDGFQARVTGGFVPPDGDLEQLGLDPWALLRGVTEHVDVDVEAGRATVTMTWPAAAAA